MFCDIDKDTYLMDVVKLRQLLVENPKGTFKGIIPVDFAGYPQNLEELKEIADEYGLWILEDACHAPGAEKDNIVEMEDSQMREFFPFIR